MHARNMLKGFLQLLPKWGNCKMKLKITGVRGRAKSIRLYDSFGSLPFFSGLGENLLLSSWSGIKARKPNQKSQSNHTHAGGSWNLNTV